MTSSQEGLSLGENKIHGHIWMRGYRLWVLRSYGAKNWGFHFIIIINIDHDQAR